jgi:hypothetical protein
LQVAERLSRKLSGFSEFPLAYGTAEAIADDPWFLLHGADLLKDAGQLELAVR